MSAVCVYFRDSKGCPPPSSWNPAQGCSHSTPPVHGILGQQDRPPQNQSNFKMTQQATNDPHLNWSCNYSSCSSDKYRVSAIRRHPCLVASLKQQAEQKCCPYLVHLAMSTVQVTREQPCEERSQRTMTILLWAWRVENSTKEPPSLYHVPRHSGLFFVILPTVCSGSLTATACLEVRSIFGRGWPEVKAELVYVLYTAFFGLTSVLEI